MNWLNDENTISTNESGKKTTKTKQTKTQL